MTFQDESHATDSFLDLRKERVETFRKYGQLFYCLQSKQKYFAMLIDSMRNKTDASLPSIILATFNYLSTSEDEARALQVLTLALKLQMNSEEMIENLIAGNPLLFEYSTHFFKCMRNDESKKFLDSIVPIIDEIISLKKGCYYLNPLKIYVTLTDNRPDTLDTETALENPDITKKLDENIDLIISYAKNILSKFKDDPNSIPYPVRYCFKVILENEELTTKQKRKIIANLFFSKYLSYMIAIPEDNKLTTKKFEEIGDDARYILSEVRNILKNIAFGKLYGESYLNRLNTFIEESHEELCSAYEKIIDIRVLSEEYQILNNSDYVETLETVTEHVDKILHLHKLLNTYAPQFRLKGDDILMQCLKSLGEPNIDNFLRDTSVDNIKKMEMARKFVGIDLVRKIKQVDPNKPLSSKKKLLNAKLMVIQMLFAVDMNNFNPNTINELLDHHWTDVEHQKHKDNIELSEQFQLTHAQEDEKKTVNRSSSKLSADSSLAGYSHRSNAVLVEELRKTLPEIQVLTKQLINELAESKILSKDDNYQKLIDLISEDVKNAHKRNVSMRREQAILKKSKDDLKKRSKESDSMKDYFRKYIDSLEKNYNRDSTNKRKSIFSIIKPKTVKEKTYSAEKFKKNGIVKEIKLNVANSPKHYSFRITPLDKGKFDISFIVLGNEQETKTFDMTSLLLQSYNKETQFEGLKGIIFDVKKLYNFLEAFRAG
ncbi:MAG: Ras GTPase-activating-like protein iqgap2 [Paramarteilia canceri]